jgi:hypothetical protein
MPTLIADLTSAEVGDLAAALSSAVSAVVAPPGLPALAQRHPNRASKPWPK